MIVGAASGAITVSFSLRPGSVGGCAIILCFEEIATLGRVAS
jgi:hypothetical protein